MRKSAAFVEDVERDVLFARDEGICGICGEPVDPTTTWTVDHIIPLEPRPGHPKGEHSYANTQVTHRSCNSWKKNKPFEEWSTDIKRRADLATRHHRLHGTSGSSENVTTQEQGVAT